MSFVHGITAIAVITAVGLAIAFALDFTRRRYALQRIGHAPQIRRMMASLSGWRRVLKAVLVVVAMTVCVTALGRPQVKGKEYFVQRGIDLVVVMDFSKSMLARDVYPSRLERMKEEVEELFIELKSDRVATVVFSGAAAHFPLTHDYESAASMFRGLMPADMPPGSDLGEAIMIARCIVRPELHNDPGCERIGGRGRGGQPLDGAEAQCERPGASAPEIANRGQAIVVFTDGEDTEGRARAEVERAVALGVHVYFVGVGTRSGDLIPELDREGNEIGWKKNPDGSFVSTRLDQAALKDLGDLAGGWENHYFPVDPDRFRTTDLIKHLSRVKKGDLDKRSKNVPQDVFQWLLFPAFMLLLIEACVSERRRRVIYPEEQDK